MAALVGGALAVFLAAATVVYLRGRGGTPGIVGRALRMLAFAAAVGIVVALLPFTVEDSGAAAIYLLGVPLVAATAALAADLTGHAVGLTTTIAALVTLAWGLLLGLGIGMWFAIPAVILGCAAIATLSSRDPAVPSGRKA
ncbi:hypothetical protein [Jidongwangia harbinensis]|uniref:hypothetical protein n=1 Tax=Jidongwangia harbinensis TaxID=2878561 RepID=UPI001CD9A210|nr:hypothetical protein [Jidongwangia harbinensis]MCA2212051.1 hypothetical protein [Jidongwangia harbinensis]